MFSEKEKSIPLDKRKNIFYNLIAERTGEIENLHNSVNFKNLVYHTKGPTKNINFIDFIDAKILFDDIKPKNNKIWRFWKKWNDISIQIK